LGPLHISGTVGARNFKFDMQIDYEEFLLKEIKMRSKGVTKGSCDILLKFGTPPYLGNGWSWKLQICQAD